MVDIREDVNSASNSMTGDEFPYKLIAFQDSNKDYGV
jgi:hypothetical protein